MKGARRDIAILLSGRGTNFLAIHEGIRSGEIPARIVAVISNRPQAAGLLKATELGLPAFSIDHRGFPSREEHEDAVINILQQRGAELVVLAGYMRLLSARMVESYRNRIVNIHPSLLPSFPGVNAQAQALDYGVRVSGCTVHLVDEHLDAGPIVVQRAVPVLEDDTEEALSARILEQEHAAFVEALRKLCGGYSVDGRRVRFSQS